jgi:hypothetical protein
MKEKLDERKYGFAGEKSLHPGVNQGKADFLK